MDDLELKEKLEAAVWVAHSLFERGKTTGSSANMSIRHKDLVYISASGSCIGTMSKEDFTAVTMDGTPVFARKPSKEWPLHLALYQKSPDIGAVIHTHSTYSVLWSFMPAASEQDCIPEHTPYLKMKLGTVVPGKTVMDAFYCLEELEESARIAWELYRAGLK